MSAFKGKTETAQLGSVACKPPHHKGQFLREPNGFSFIFFNNKWKIKKESNPLLCAKNACGLESKSKIDVRRYPIN